MAELRLRMLTGMRELLARPEQWTQEELAKDEHGKGADAMGARASCWCIVGAANRARYELSIELAGDARDADTLKDARDRAAAAEHEAIVLLSRLAGEFSEWLTPWECLTAWNDNVHRTHADILSLLDRAIEADREGA